MTNEGEGKRVFLSYVSEKFATNKTAVSYNFLPDDLIVTSDDKLRLYLQNYLSKAEKGREWIAPLSLFLALLLALVSSDFHDALLPAATWHAIFIISAVLSFIWLILALRNALRTQSIDALIEQIKKGRSDPQKRGH